jgi:serine/threonine protein kinase
VAGRYRIVEPLGESNTGRIFRAEQLDAGDRPVRLVVLHRELVEDLATYTQIEREVEKVEPVHHPNLLEVHHLEAVEGASFLVLEWANGFSLLELLRARRELHAKKCCASCRRPRMASITRSAPV